MEHGAYLLQVLILLGAIVAVVPLLQRIGAGSVAGYLVAGLLIGPPVLGWVTEYQLIASVAEFGVVFLLFSIGIELRPARLWVMRRLVFGLGTAQLLLCAAAISGILVLLGITGAAAIVIGLALALSSTAIVVQLLSERRELNNLRGRATLSVLLLQDVAVAPLITMVYLLGSRGEESVSNPLFSVLQSLAMLAAVLVIGRLAWRHVFPMLASNRNADILVAVTLLLVLGAAWLMEHAGMSLAMGAFLAGVLLADSPFRHQVVADIQPFRGLLLGLFFMSVGMQIDRDTVMQSGLLLLGMTLAMMALKTLIIAALLRSFRMSTGDALQGGLLLSQAGEFALILFALAASEGVIAADLKQMLFQVVVFSMLLTPLADWAGTRLAKRFESEPSKPPGAAFADPGHDGGHVIICGYGRVGRQIARLLDAAQIRWVATDLSSATIEQASQAGLPVYYGDCSRGEILRALDIDSARLVLLTLDSVAATENTVHAIRTLVPAARIIARASDSEQAHSLYAQGVLRAVPETSEYSLQLALAGLCELGMDAGRRQQLEDDFRDNEYARLTGNEIG